MDGLLVPPGQPGPLPDALVRLASDPALAATLGERARGGSRPGPRPSAVHLASAMADVPVSLRARPKVRIGPRASALDDVAAAIIAHTTST